MQSDLYSLSRLQFTCTGRQSTSKQERAFFWDSQRGVDDPIEAMFDEKNFEHKKRVRLEKNNDGSLEHELLTFIDTVNEDRPAFQFFRAEKNKVAPTFSCCPYNSLHTTFACMCRASILKSRIANRLPKDAP